MGTNIIAAEAGPGKEGFGIDLGFWRGLKKVSDVPRRKTPGNAPSAGAKTKAPTPR